MAFINKQETLHLAIKELKRQYSEFHVGFTCHVIRKLYDGDPVVIDNFRDFLMLNYSEYFYFTHEKDVILLRLGFTHAEMFDVRIEILTKFIVG